MPELEKVKCSTPDFAKENAKKLLALFPECEGQRGEVDIDKLRQVLSSTAIEGNVERYQFTWPGKRNAMAAASAATTKTLRPCAAESVGRDGTPGGFDSENLYIEGDNLEVLKLLQTSYAGKVKMIYIDPPYNTGHDFVYRDRFSLTQKELDDNAGAFDEDGNRFEVNDSAEARYHSNWCSMMYPRLKLARNLLRDDGVIFISIDDNEVANLRKLCDEVFGEHNFVANFLWKKKGTTSNVEGAEVSSLTDATLCYKKSETAHIHPRVKSKECRSYPLHDKEGKYRLTIIEKKDTGDYKRDSMKFQIIGHAPREGKRWQIGADKAKALEAKGRFVFDGEKVQLKIYDFEDKDTTSAWPNLFDDCGSSDSASQMVNQDIMGGAGIFDTPKPIELLLRILLLSSDDDSIILDFFSGSATTAHAVVQLNAEDGGCRKFIMVQLPEPCDEDSEAAKAGYANICEIGKERIRRAGKKIAEENATIAPNLDIGFRVLKLDTSSLRDTSATVSETNQEFANFERVRSDRSAEDLLFQMLLETHIPLSEPIVKAKVSGNEVLFVGMEAARSASAPYQNAPLAACLDAKAKMTTEFFIEIAKLKPGIAFFRDDAFVDDSARTNLQQVFNQFSPTTSIKVI
ncbi:MAG: site-specific DNA-methyltransferase [Kiritimatiellae bacterium]|nr:site-specific DNA-methyltransferase [Kiritimatiellia bacterium]